MSRSHARPILCGIDGSELSRSVAAVAGAFARRLGTRLVLTYVADVDDPLVRATTHRSAPREHPPSAVIRVVKPILSEQRLEADIGLEFGEPGTVLIDAAKERGAALLVVGSRGQGPLKTGLPGSVSRRLARAAPCPLVVVPPAASASCRSSFIHDGPQPLILCGIDHAQGFRPLFLAADLALRLDARLLLAHAHDHPPPAASAVAPGELPFDMETVLEASKKRGRGLLDRAARMAVDEGVGRVETRLIGGDPARSLRALAAHQAADLLLVGSRGRGWRRSAVLGSVSSALEASSPIPVAILPSSARIARGSGHYELKLGRAARDGPMAGRYDERRRSRAGA